MKGIELPINVLIFVAIGVIVLIGLIVLLGIGIGGVSPVIVESEKTIACNTLVNTYNCKSGYTSSISVDYNKIRVNNLQELCNKYKGCGATAITGAGAATTAFASAEECCRVNVCGCAP